jgi:site-specific recombinase XerC
VTWQEPAKVGVPFRIQPALTTKASLILQRTKNLRAIQLLLGHTKLQSTAGYPGIEVDDALAIAEQTVL